METLVGGGVSTYQCAAGNSAAMSRAYSECTRVATLSSQQLSTDVAFHGRRQRYGSVLREEVDRYSRRNPTITVDASEIVSRVTAVVDARCATSPADSPWDIEWGPDSNWDQLIRVTPALEQPGVTAPTCAPPTRVERATPSTGGATAEQLDTTVNVGGDDTASYASGGLPVEDLLALGAGNTAGNPRAHAPGVVLDDRGVAIGEDGAIEDEVVMTAAEDVAHTTKATAKKAMSHYCLAAFKAGELDLNGHIKEDRDTAANIATTYGHGLCAQDVLKVFTNARHRQRSAKPSPPAQTKPKRASSAGKPAETEPAAEAESTVQRDADTTCANPSQFPPPRNMGTTDARSVIDEHMAGMHKASPSKPGGACNRASALRLSDAIDDHPERPYKSLYDAPYRNVTDATTAATVLGLELSRRIERVKERKSSTETKYCCACSGCTESLEDGRPFRLVLTKIKDMYYFDKEKAQHRHGWRCVRSKPITPKAGHVQEVRDFVQQNHMVDNGVLMSYLVRNLNFDKPRDVTLTEQGRVILGNTWSQTMKRLKLVAWGGYGPELDELAVWTRLFNENASNGYAVMRLTRDDKLVVYDGLTQERPEGEFQSFSCVFRPTLMACMRAGVSAISADSTFLPLRPDLNMLVCEGECPSAMSNGLTIVPVANHLCFGESGESYIDMWKFMVDYSDGIAAQWLHGITLHADRGPGGCMASALAHVLPSAIFRSCAFHVWQALERNVPPKDRIDRKLFMTLVDTITQEGFRRLLTHIRKKSPASFQYIIDSGPEEYCKGHPDFVTTFNTGVNNSLAEVEMNRLKPARRTGKSIMNLQSNVAGIVHSTCEKWLREVRSINHGAPGDFALMPSAVVKIRESMQHVTHYNWLGEQPLVDIMSKGGNVQLVSNFKGAGAERATYTVCVKPGASCLADLTCDCSLRLATEHQVACVHIAKLVHDPVVEAQTPDSVHKHQLLAGKVWHAKHCKAVFEDELMELLLPNCSLVPGLVADGVTVRDLAQKPGRKSDKRMVSRSQALTPSSRHATGAGLGAAPPAQQFGATEFAIKKTCAHEPGSLDDIRCCAHCQAQCVNDMLDPQQFQCGTLCELVYENAKGETSTNEILYAEPEKHYRGALKGQANGERFYAFRATSSASSGQQVPYRFDRVLSIRILRDQVAPAELEESLRQMLNGSAAARRAAAKADQVKQKAEADERKRAELAEKAARREADEITHEVQRCLTEVLVKVRQLAKQEKREETKRKREEREEEAQRKRKRDEEARVAKEERRMRNEEVRITKEVTSCLEKLVSTTVRTVETEERAAKRAQEKQARLEEKARAEPARSKAKAVKSTPRNVQQQREHRNVKASRASTSRRAQATPRHEPKPKALPKPKGSPQKRPAAVSNDGELWPKYKTNKRRRR